MDNHVVIAMRDALAAAGARTLRFNLRGAGGSGGAFEPTLAVDDAEAALGALTAARPTLPVRSPATHMARNWRPGSLRR